jgi:hypothetical protein
VFNILKDFNNVKKKVIFLDTPGRGDTKNAEVDISNAVGIVRTIRGAQIPIYPVILFSPEDSGSRG